MNTDQEKKPLAKVKVRVKRAGESSRVSTKNDGLPEKADLIETVLPEALRIEAGETEEKEKSADPIVFETITENSLSESKAIETESELVKFIPMVQDDKPEDVKTEFVEEAEEYHHSTNTGSIPGKKLFTRFSDMGVIRKILVILCIIFCLWSIIPIVKGIIGIGLYAPLFIGLFALFTVSAWDFISSVESKLWKLLWAVIAIVAMAGASAFAFVSGHMISASNNTAPANNNNLTVVVLGCKVYGSEPSKMLKGRLDKAAEYLLTHPGVNCIVTGGKGNDEDLPEAAVMKKYLVERGISASRIKTDDESFSTRENIQNALEVAKENNYYTTFYIVTDRFHQLRARIVCKEQNITSYALSSETPWYLTMYYWFREMFGIAHYTVYKN